MASLVSGEDQNLVLVEFRESVSPLIHRHPCSIIQVSDIAILPETGLSMPFYKGLKPKNLGGKKAK